MNKRKTILLLLPMLASAINIHAQIWQKVSIEEANLNPFTLFQNAAALTVGKTWTDVTSKISMPKGISHGTAISVDRSVVESLIKLSQSPI